MCEINLALLLSQYQAYKISYYTRILYGTLNKQYIFEVTLNLTIFNPSACEIIQNLMGFI